MRSLLVATLCIGCALATLAHAQPDPEARPNVVLIITDDLGWADLGSYGATDIRTPNIDSLARDGVRLTDFYANGVTCSPTRAGLISGRYQQRYGIEAPLPNARPRAAIAACRRRATRCRSCSRTTATRPRSIGKWHLGYKPEKSPNAHGFDYFFGFKSGYHDYYTHHGGDGEPDLWENDKPIEQTGYTTDLVTERAARFIEQHGDAPFFVDVAYNGAALAVSGAGQPVRRAEQRSPRDAAGSGDEHARGLRGHGRAPRSAVGEILAAIDRAGRGRRHDRDLHERQRRRVAVEQRAALRPQMDRVRRRHPRSGASCGGPSEFRPARSPIRSASRWISRASILAVTGTPVPAEAKLEGMNLFPVWEGGRPSSSARCSGAPARAPASRPPCAAATGRCSSTAAHVRVQPAQRPQRAQRPREMAARRRSGAAAAARGLGERRRRRSSRQSDRVGRYPLTRMREALALHLARDCNRLHAALSSGRFPAVAYPASLRAGLSDFGGSNTCGSARIGPGRHS